MVTANTRKSRISQIMAAIKAATNKGENVDKEKLISKLCCDWGVSRRTALEYLDNIIGADYAKEYEEGGRQILLWNK